MKMLKQLIPSAQVIKLSFIQLINVKIMYANNLLNCSHFNIYELDKFHAQFIIIKYIIKYAPYLFFCLLYVFLLIHQGSVTLVYSPECQISFCLLGKPHGHIHLENTRSDKIHI